MHQLTHLREKDFRPKVDITGPTGRRYAAGLPMCKYRSSHGYEFIQMYDGPFHRITNQQYYGLLRGIGIRDDIAIRLSGHRPQSFTSPVKNIVPPAPAPIVPMPAGQSTQQQTNKNITSNMARKPKNQPAAPAATPAPAPAPVAAAPAPAPAAPPPPPVPGAAVPQAPAGAQPATASGARKPGEKSGEPEQNGVTRPATGTTTRTVWDTADRISAESGAPATRKTVVDACTALGINSSTATTQFGKWAKFHGHTGAASPGRAAAPAGAPAPAPAPAPAAPAAAAAPVSAAFDAGVSGYDRAAAGEQVANPYSEGSPDAQDFLNGWNARHAQVAAA